MKKLLFFVALLLIATLSNSQTFNVISKEKLNLDGEYVGAKLDNSGTKLLVSEKKNLNLLLVDLSKNSTIEICEEEVNVSSAVFSADGKNVFFTKSFRVNNRLYKDLYSYDTTSKASKAIERQARNLTNPSIYNNKLLYSDNSKLKKVDLKQTHLTASSSYYVTIENQHLVFYANGVRQVIDPCGKGSYIWPSLSPDGDKILFYEVRKGAFIYNLFTKETTSIGKIQAPVWMNNNWIAGMITNDDGHMILSGEILVIDVNGDNKQIISSEETINLYPTAATEGNKIAYVTDKGEVYIITYAIK